MSPAALSPGRPPAGPSRRGKLLRSAAAVGNGLLVIAVAGSFVFGEADWHDPRAWKWLAILLGCPSLNLLGLLWRRASAFTVLAAICNAVAMLAWGGIILLMLVWPLGNKPAGLDLAAILVSWLILLLSEVALLRLVKPSPAGQSGA